LDARVFRRVQRYGWDAATNAYDRGWVPLLERLTVSCVTRAAPRAGERFLDLATGTGIGAFAAARAVGQSGAVTGVDISEKMVTLASLRAAAEGFGNITFQRRDMESTGVPAGAFDAVTCAFGLMFAAERPAAFAEMARVTAPGGRVSICVWGRRAACGFAQVFPIVDAHVQSEVCPLFFSLGGHGAPRVYLERAGFRDVVEESVPVTLSWESADAACQAMLEGGAVALAWNRFSAETRAIVRADYLASLEPFRRGDRYDVAAEVMFATAHKPR
jgi:ubiquinone/menaquinone biosynthesis C-methylase UbiE